MLPCSPSVTAPTISDSLGKAQACACAWAPTSQTWECHQASSYIQHWRLRNTHATKNLICKVIGNVCTSSLTYANLITSPLRLSSFSSDCPHQEDTHGPYKSTAEERCLAEWHVYSKLLYFDAPHVICPPNREWLSFPILKRGQSYLFLPPLEINEGKSTQEITTAYHITVVTREPYPGGLCITGH